MISANFLPLPIPAGGLENPFLLKCSCYKQAIFEFVQTLYDYSFVGTVTEDNSDKEDKITIGIISNPHPHGDQQLADYSDTTGTVTKEDNSDEEDRMQTALSESQPLHGDRQLVNYTDSDSNSESCSSKQQP